MDVSVKTMRRIAGTAALLSFVCFCMDCFRASRASASFGYFAAVFIADIWGFVPYNLKILGKKNYAAGGGAVPVVHNRTHQIVWRLIFFVLALIAPCIELVNAGYLNSHLYDMMSSTSSMARSLLERVAEDAIAACWGDMGDALRAAAKYSVDGDSVVSTCAALQARTVFMLIVSVLVLVETILYKRSNVGTEAWVQEELEKMPSATAALGGVGAQTTIEMTAPAHSMVYSAPYHPSPAPPTPASPYTPPTVVDTRTTDLERGVVQSN